MVSESGRFFKNKLAGLSMRVVGKLFPRLADKFFGSKRAVEIYMEGLRQASGDNILKVLSTEMVRSLPPEEHILVPGFQIAKERETGRFRYQSEFNDLDIKPGEKVLDIGSGGHPFPLATHLADLFEGETMHRKEVLVKDARPFLVCDIADLPFNDKEFDFIYCSHVLEHVDDPGKACEEIMRVGKRGYIETPTRLSDVMFNFTKLKGHHKWHISMLENTLVFLEWREGEQKDTGIDDFFAMHRSKYVNPFKQLVESQRDLFANMLMWAGGFNYYVFDRHGRLLEKAVKYPAQVR